MPTGLFRHLAQTDLESVADIGNSVGSSIGNSPGATLSMLVFVGIGLVLILFGRKFAKTALSLAGVFYGVMLALLLSEVFNAADEWLFLVVLAGGLLGLGLTRVVFRFWTTVGTALLLGYLVPAFMLAAIDARFLTLPQDGGEVAGSPYTVAAEEAQKKVQEATGNLQARDATEALDAVTENLDRVDESGRLSELFSIFGGADEDAPATQGADESQEATQNGTQDGAENDTQDGAQDGAQDGSQDAAPSIADSRVFEKTTQAGGALIDWLRASGQVLRQMYTAETIHLHGWWQEKGAGYRQQLMIGALVGLAAGAGLGLLMPKTATSLQTSLIGAVLLTIPGRTLLEQTLGPDRVAGWLPYTPRMVLLTVCLITIAGLIFQCRPRRKKAD